MIEIGRMCVKTAGRDAGLKCVIVEIIDDTFVRIDGQTRARKCNIRHLEPLGIKLELGKGAAHEEVLRALKKQGVEIAEPEKKRAKKAEKSAKPTKKRDKAAKEQEKSEKTGKPAKQAKK